MQLLSFHYLPKTFCIGKMAFHVGLFRHDSEEKLLLIRSGNTRIAEPFRKETRPWRSCMSGIYSSRAKVLRQRLDY
jgi:hypothetical protein